MSDTSQQFGSLEPQNDPNTNVRVPVVTMVNNLPPSRVRSALLLCTNIQITNAGILYVMLGGACSIPLYINAPAALTVAIEIFRSDTEFLELSDFSLSQPLEGGIMSLLTVS